MADGKERGITRDFVSWIQEKRPGSVWVEQFKLTEGGTVDLSVFSYTNSLELECWAIECKTGITLSRIYEYLEQLARYRSHFPWIYLLVGTIKDKDKEALRKVCEASRMGLYLARSSKDIECISEAKVSRFDEIKFAKIRSLGALLHCFKEEFATKSPQLKSWGAYTEGVVQFNAYIAHEATCRLAVNAENIHKGGVVRKFDNGIKRFFRDLPQEASVMLRRYHWIAPRHSVELPVLEGQVGDVDITKVRNLPKASNVTVQINISIPLWSVQEFLTREQHMQRFSKAKELLRPLFDYLSG